MNKSMITILAVVILALASVGLLVLSKDGLDTKVSSGDQRNSEPSAEVEPQNNQTTLDEKQPENSKPTGSYLSYSETALSETEGDSYLFFHAPWCSQCRAIEEDIVSEGVPDGVAIFKVNYDSNQELRKKYGITIQTTFVKVNQNGEKQDLYVAYNEPTFNAVKRDFIN